MLDLLEAEAICKRSAVISFQPANVLLTHSQAPLYGTLQETDRTIPALLEARTHALSALAEAELTGRMDPRC
jgi:hypothetical protein